MRKTALPLIALLVVSWATDGLVTASPSTTVYVDPRVSRTAPLENFNVNVTVREVVDLVGWEINMTFDPSVLEAYDAVEPYPSEQKIWSFLAEKMDNARGWIAVAGIRPFGVKEGLSGTWKLATIIFRVKAEGSCPLHFAKTILANSDVEEIPHDVKNGRFTTLIGDVDGDGDVDLFDFTRLLWAYDTAVGDDLYDPDADFDKDGGIDLSDLYWVLWNWGKVV